MSVTDGDLHMLHNEVELAACEAAADQGLEEGSQDMVWHDIALNICAMKFKEAPDLVNEFWRCEFGETFEARMRATGGAL